MMGGRIGVDTEQGRGSTFWFTVDFEKQQTAPAGTPSLGHQPSEAADEGSALPTSGLVEKNARILLAEDNPVNQEIFLAILGRHGFAADAVPNGAEALKALKKSPYDLVFMDCEMPVLDGYEATRQIRNPETGTLNPRVPIVAVTANAMPGDREKCLRCGMDDYLPKPIEPEEMLRVLAKWLRKPTLAEKPRPSEDAAPTQDNSVFDKVGLLKRLAGNKALAKKLVGGFLQDVPLQLSILRQQLAAGDAPSARRQAHSLKGAAANLSAGGLRMIAFEAEQAAMAGQLIKLAEILPTMEGEFEKLRTVLGGSEWT
jgi:CheY-like chemotaxis protein/HPt (histidine-containing phosphotransfer) domain-containing protein